MPLRVWSEFLSLPELAQPAVANLLAKFDCALLPRLTSRQLEDPKLRAGLEACRAAGIPELGVWLLLDEADGYWPSERNAGLVLALTRRIAGLRLPATWLAIDLEPPLSQARALAALEYPRRAAGEASSPVRMFGDSAAASARRALTQWRFARENLDPRRFAQAHRAYAEVIAVAHHAGLRVLCAAHDYLAEDVWLGRRRPSSPTVPGSPQDARLATPPRAIVRTVQDVELGQPILQDLHEAPVLGLSWDVVSVMLYGSLLGRPATDTRRWLYDTARCLSRLRMGASIGLTGVGVLGDEPYYESPDELAADAAALKAAGVDDFAIYSLEGILNSPHPEGWLEAIRAAEPRVPAETAWAKRERTRRRVQAALWMAVRLLARGPRRR